jgi:nucleotide-binding universal stress UspA family protein
MEAQAYLERVMKKIAASDLARLNLSVSSSAIVHEDVAHALVDIAESGGMQKRMVGFNESDAIALTTHGRKGLQHWVMGSVAERVMNSTQLPLLIMS